MADMYTKQEARKIIMMALAPIQKRMLDEWHESVEKDDEDEVKALVCVLLMRMTIELIKLTSETEEN